MKYAVCFILLLVPQLAAAGDLWAVATVRSYHWHRPTDNNERNYGLGFEYAFRDRWTVSGGYYENSHYRQTMYLGSEYAFAQYGSLKLRVGGGLVTGYRDGNDYLPMLLVAPMVSYEWKHVGINVLTYHQVIGLQVKYKWN